MLVLEAVASAAFCAHAAAVSLPSRRNTSHCKNAKPKLGRCERTHVALQVHSRHPLNASDAQEMGRHAGTAYQSWSCTGRCDIACTG